jgi:hypothetical protein
MKQTITNLIFNSKLLGNSLYKRISFTLLCSSMLLISAHTQAQKNGAFDKELSDLTNRSGLSLQLGSNTFLGDLGGNSGNGKPFIKDWNLKASKLFAGLSYTYFLDKGLSLNADVHLTSVSSADSLSDKTIGHSLGRYNRNLSFKSNIYELQVTGELYPLQIVSERSTPKLMPYIGAGVGFFHFNPKAQLNGQWYNLQPLHLEGQGFAEYPERSNYKLTQVYIPLTLGVKYRISENNLISLNTIFRITFTDYIDDASTGYINPALFVKYLEPDAASIAKQLYYRGVYSTSPKTSSNRGYSGNDSYTSVFLSLTHLF